MGYRKISACVGCAECISCWRHSHYEMEFYCDKCDTENVKLYDFEGKQVCYDCVVDALATKQKGECADCEETDYLFEIDGKKVCEYCFSEYLQEIDYEVE